MAGNGTKPNKPTYRVNDWEKHFECASTRKITGALKWVPLPCRHDGATFRRLMRRDDGLAIYGCWVLILQVAAKCRTRGVLSGDHGPIGPEELELITDVSATTFEAAIGVLTSPEIGWMESSDNAFRQRPPRSATAAADVGGHNPSPATTAADVGSSEPSPAALAVYRKEGKKEGEELKASAASDIFASLDGGAASESPSVPVAASSEHVQHPVGSIAERKADLMRNIERGKAYMERDDKATSFEDWVRTKWNGGSDAKPTA